MTGPSLTTSIDAALAAGPLPLPVHPSIGSQVAALPGQGPLSAAALATLAGTDPALACSLLRAANSGFYAGLPKTRSLAEALARIGLDAAREVLAAACRDGQRAGRGPLPGRYLTPLWQHALGCALGARWLAERCGYPGLAGSAHLAGLLHDIGKWLLLASLSRLGDDGHRGGELGAGLVEEVMASMHVELGLRLLREWQLPDELAGAVGCHHEAELDALELLVALVRLANLGCRKVGLGWLRDPGLVLPTTAEAQFLNLDEIALAEFEIMLEDRFGLVPPFLTKADSQLRSEDAGQLQPRGGAL
jgi:HD-like signal output (HDOD) protein